MSHISERKTFWFIDSSILESDVENVDVGFLVVVVVIAILFVVVVVVIVVIVDAVGCIPHSTASTVSLN